MILQWKAEGNHFQALTYPAERYQMCKDSKPESYSKIDQILLQHGGWALDRIPYDSDKNANATKNELSAITKAARKEFTDQERGATYICKITSAACITDEDDSDERAERITEAVTTDRTDSVALAYGNAGSAFDTETLIGPSQTEDVGGSIRADPQRRGGDDHTGDPTRANAQVSSRNGTPTKANDVDEEVSHVRKLQD
ncbi:hypothetical protein PRIC1_004470 [Phytophthora ramorum]